MHVPVTTTSFERIDPAHIPGEDYSTPVSCCLSSATAAWIAAVIVAIRAIFAAGVKSKVAPISSPKIFSAASIASVGGGLHGAPLGIIGGGSVGCYG
jgi:hypothetical protein